MAKKKNKSIEFDGIKVFDPEEENVDFPSICKFIRKTFNVTQQEMSLKLQISSSAYAYWESGDRVPKSWQCFRLRDLYEAAKQLAAKQQFATEQTSDHSSPNPQQQAA
ncbi:MAG: hypothetical protein FD167_1425 [bacterium]|nr:MAG: hypothetical protein FD167_1425 [bacterium]